MKIEIEVYNDKLAKMMAEQMEPMAFAYFVIMLIGYMRERDEAFQKKVTELMNGQLGVKGAKVMKAWLGEDGKNGS